MESNKLNKSESKYYNTASLMDEALILLLEKKEYSFITVKEICEKAGVNRSTFYLHYETIDDLLSECIEYAILYIALFSFKNSKYGNKYSGVINNKSSNLESFITCLFITLLLNFLLILCPTYSIHSESKSSIVS